MQAERLDDGRIRIPRRAEADGVIGDGMVIVAPGDPGYDEWDAWLRQRSQMANMPHPPSAE